MTAAEQKVRERYPDAKCRDVAEDRFVVGYEGVVVGAVGFVMVGFGRSENGAWEDAASRLTSQTGE